MAKCVGVKSRPKELTPKHYDRKNTREKMHDRKRARKKTWLREKMHDRKMNPIGHYNKIIISYRDKTIK